ncbi:MAG: class I SAM-dependent methyltransferase [Thermoplasmatales archaeon]|nr:class I SAM-dependent methyltransferase [Thermoplasmatales archaeon]
MKISEYEKEQKMIEQKIWALPKIEKGLALDIGVGDKGLSTRKLIELGAKVVAVDFDLNNLIKQKNLDKLVQCNAPHLPFKNSVFDLSVAFFTLHEINPRLHLNVVSEMARVSKKVMIVEPMPGQEPVNKRYDDVWSKAMHSIGKFEDHQEIMYWKKLMEKCSLGIVVCEKFREKNRIPPQKVDESIEGIVTLMNSYGVSKKYIEEIKGLGKDMRNKGMRRSSIGVVIGEH